MPHVVIKMYPGRSEQQKARLAEAITKNITEILACREEVVSIAMEEVKPEEWEEKVDKPEIQPNWDRLYKRPG